MSRQKVEHGSFVIDRALEAAPAVVFRAWAEEAAKRRWFADSADTMATDHYSLDFREGGRELWRGLMQGGMRVENDTIYRDIVRDERIVLCYDMIVNGARMSSSLLTVEFFAKGGGLLLKLTEQAVFFGEADGLKLREAGWRELLDALEKTLRH